MMKYSMIRQALSIRTFSVALLLPLLPVSAAGSEVAGVCGVYPADDGAYMAVQVSHGPEEAVAGLRWFNNDGQQPFTGLILVEAVDGNMPKLQGGSVVLGEIWGLSSDWSEVVLEQPVVSSTGHIHAIFVLPAGGIRSGEGAFSGHGIGFEIGEGGLPSFVSADAELWSPLHTSYGFAVEAIYYSGSGKMKPLMLKDLSEYDLQLSEENTTETDRPEKPRTALLSARPNPFNPRTEIRYSLEREGPVRIVVYDARGRRIRTLVNETRGAGLQSVMWLGKDDSAGTVASGVYYVKMDFAGRTMTQAITLVR